MKIKTIENSDVTVAYHEPDGEFTTIANKVFKVKLR